MFLLAGYEHCIQEVGGLLIPSQIYINDNLLPVFTVIFEPGLKGTGDQYGRVKSSKVRVSTVLLVAVFYLDLKYCR